MNKQLIRRMITPFLVAVLLAGLMIQAITVRVAFAEASTDTCLAVNMASDATYVSITGLPATSTGSTGTVEAWIYPTDTSGARSIIRRTGAYNLLINGGNLYAELWPDGSSVGGASYTASAISVNQWTHVAMTWNGATITLYVNGNVVTASSGGVGVFTVEDFLIGYSTNFAQQFYGTIDEVRVWNTTRSQIEIQNNMNLSLVGNESGLVGLYHFNEGSGATANDSATGDGAQNGTLNNTFTWPTSPVPSSVCSSVVPGANGGDGPGGVGIADGSSALEGWYRGDRGVYTDTGCTTLAANGNAVACWADRSGNSRNATQGTGANQPGYATSALNGQPLLQFNGSSNVLNLPAGTVPAGNSAYSVFAIVNQTAAVSRVFLGSGNYGTTGEYNAFALSSGGRIVNSWYTDDAYTNPGAVSPGTNYAFSFVYNPASGRAIWANGVSQTLASSGTTSRNGAAANNVIGSDLMTTPNYWNGNIAETIIYSSALNDTDRILAENYLSAKYNVPLGANDVYNGDDSGNGNFDLDMAGIGRFGGNDHTQSHSAGMIVVNRTFLQDNGDWLTFGHLTATNNKVNADLPTTGDWTTAPNPMRWTRHWYFNRTDAAGTTGGLVDIIFDFSEGRMDNGMTPTGPASNYRLLYRSGTSGTFSDIATATAIVGDQVKFIGVDVTLLGSNFTLGTLNDTTSPTVVELHGLTAQGNSTLLLVIVLSGALLVFGCVIFFKNKMR